MTASFEERYRRKPGSVETIVAPVIPAPAASSMDTLKEPDEYKPYNTMAHPELELWIRPNSANNWTDVYLPYSHRNHMISDGSGFVISMFFTTPVSTVIIHGRNLQELVHMLSKRQVEWVMEYDARKWPEVPPGMPCITGIEISHAPRPAKRDDDGLPGEKKQPESPSTH